MPYCINYGDVPRFDWPVVMVMSVEVLFLGFFFILSWYFATCCCCVFLFWLTVAEFFFFIFFIGRGSVCFIRIQVFEREWHNCLSREYDDRAKGWYGGKVSDIYE